MDGLVAGHITYGVKRSWEGCHLGGDILAVSIMGSKALDFKDNLNRAVLGGLICGLGMGH